MAYIRQHMLAGDPLGAVGLGTRRKSAGAGTRAKAYRHRVVRMQRLGRGMGDPFGGMVGAFTSKALGPMAASYAKSKAGGGAMDWLKGMMPKVGGFLGGLTGGKPVDYAALGKAAGQFGTGAMASLQRRGATPSLGFLPGSDFPAPPSGGGGFGGGGKRRTMNVTNVKALKRGIRRLEGFQGLVKKVNALLPSGARMHAGAPIRKGKRGKRR